MKFILLLIAATIVLPAAAQKPFEKDKKWGISRDGTGDEKDSIIFRADFEEIKTLDTDVLVFAGLRGGEWQFLTTNKLVNQQRYETVSSIDYRTELVYGYREGYIDIISCASEDFVIRGVQANGFADGEDYMLGEHNYLMTERGKELYGVVNIATGKEILKAEYLEIWAQDDVGDIEFCAYKDGKNFVTDKAGKVLFSLECAEIINSIKDMDGVDDTYLLISTGKKADYYGAYDRANKRFIPPNYTEDIHALDHTSDAIVVSNSKGEKGLYFLGKLLVECSYLDLKKSDKKGYLAIATSKKGTFYITPEGKAKVLED